MLETLFTKDVIRDALVAPHVILAEEALPIRLGNTLETVNGSYGLDDAYQPL